MTDVDNLDILVAKLRPVIREEIEAALAASKAPSIDDSLGALQDLTSALRDLETCAKPTSPEQMKHLQNIINNLGAT